jgi:hypothetical protein
MKIAATASYKAVPSLLLNLGMSLFKMCSKIYIFIVAPNGNMNLVTLRSILLFSSRQRNVIGNVAALDAVPTAVNQACSMPFKNMNGFFRVTKTYINCVVTIECIINPIMTVSI